MKGMKLGFLALALSVTAFSLTYAAGDVAKGKAMFNDTYLARGTTGKSCNSCHPNGKGLEKAAGMKDLEATVNRCIAGALKGNPLDATSADMADMVAYIKSLQAKE
jgi:cytochrome c